MILGVHVSISGKIYESVDRAVALRCSAMQIFSRNPRQWRALALSPEDILEFRKRRIKSGIKVVAVHVPYLINLATSFDALYRKSIDAYVEDILETEALGAEYLVTHMGSYKNSTLERGLDQYVKALDVIFQRTQDSKVTLLLENTAGSGHWLGATFDHHQHIRDAVRHPERLGICLDTAHLFGAGWDIRRPEVFDALLADMEVRFGKRMIKVVHLNDSEAALGSLADRHTHIGKGEIGLKGMRYIVNHPKLKDAAFILETPKDVPKDDKTNLARVRRLLDHQPQRV